MKNSLFAQTLRFAYKFYPRQSLEETVRQQARKLATTRLRRVTPSMLLESQQLIPPEQKKIIEAEVEKIIRQMPRELWENHD